MNIRPIILIALLGASLLLMASQCGKDNGAAREELPQEIAANLKQVPNSKLLVSVPPVTVNAPGGPGGPLPLPKSCMTTQDFTSYVLYPVTICSSDPNFGTVLSQYLAFTGPTNSSELSPGGVQVKTFKLSSFAGRNLTPFLVCHLRSGPWFATIVKTIDCSDVTSCTMTISCPGCPPFRWFGKTCESTDRPPEVQFFGPLGAGLPSSVRCPGSLSNCGSGDEPGPTPSPPHPALL